MPFPNYSTEPVTHWVPTPDGFGGHSFSAPTVLNGRWEEKSERAMNSEGVEVVSNTVVFLDADVDEGDYLYRGSSVIADPTTLDARQVQVFQKIPDIRNVSSIRKALLQ